MSRRQFDRPPAEKPSGRPQARSPGRIPTQVLHPEQRPLIPDAFDDLPTVLAKSAASHPYLYRKRIDRFDASARPGDLVAVRLDRRTVAGYGHFNEGTGGLERPSGRSFERRDNLVEVALPPGVSENTPANELDLPGRAAARNG